MRHPRHPSALHASLLIFGLLATACDSGGAVAARGPLSPSDPIDEAFAGCQGACGAHVEGPDPDIVVQPGASIGQRTYCPVSGAVFVVDASHPHVDVDGRTLWFCCAGCAAYFETHSDEVVEARSIPSG